MNKKAKYQFLLNNNFTIFLLFICYKKQICITSKEQISLVILLADWKDRSNKEDQNIGV